MKLGALTTLLFLLTACATPAAHEGQSPRRANLHRAASLPWTDNGRCVVRESAQPWPVLAERCFRALDQERVRFIDRSGRCTVASAEAATLGIGLCVLAAPEVVAGAVIVAGVVVVAVAIKEALDEADWPEASEHSIPVQRIEAAERESAANRKPSPQSSGQDLLPPSPRDPFERDRRPECRPVLGPPRGGNEPHNECANKIPSNSTPGFNVLIIGKHYDALVLSRRTLWEVKTDDFEKHSPRSRSFFVNMKLPELQREAKLARECGYDFVIGVRSKAHLTALKVADPSLHVVIMDSC
ncbi:hypothetical protein HNS30_32360 [Corallococcus exercitus]|uniref:DUF6310 domain-containing protein n=1 Tax=Corallococcus exercitus TaxID=2316736 RepID=A0A7Y4NHL0_9BACT|nr:DUF6310 domain-containing protein [Corallococcus exercitus]NOK13751.1 hypothetical protein [Corallococcus exercitus]